MWVLKPKIEYTESDGQPMGESGSHVEVLFEPAEGQSEDEEELQKRLHDSAMRFVGSLEGHPHRAENARFEVKERIRARFRGTR